MAAQRAWTRDEQLLALRLYLSLPFGRLNQSTPEIQAAAAAIGRTPSSVAMKACNFASLDESFTKTGRKGLSGASASDRMLWNEFLGRRDEVVDEMEARFEGTALIEQELILPEGPTEVLRTVKQRRGQSFFSRSVRAAYENACAITGVKVRELNIASHIIPWSLNERRRTDPRNGLLLNALIDRAFDKGLITFDEDLRLVCAKQLRAKSARAEALTILEGTRLRTPEKFAPDPAALDWHRMHWQSHFG